jgi:seryl-tRNA synthetase
MRKYGRCPKCPLIGATVIVVSLLDIMTLDILTFIDSKGGDAEAVRESQRKRGDSVELVDEIIAMYNEWIKSMFGFFDLWFYAPHRNVSVVDFEVNGMRKQVNEVQKEIAQKKKVRFARLRM